MMMIVIPFGISSNIAERIIRNYDDGLFKHQMMITKEPACCQSAVEGPAGERRSFTSIYHTHDHHDYGLLFALFFHPTSAGYRLAGFAQYTEESKAKGLEGPLPPIFSQSCQRIFCAWASKMQLQNIKCYEGILHHKEFSMLELAFYAMALLLLERVECPLGL